MSWTQLGYFTLNAEVCHNGAHSKQCTPRIGCAHTDVCVLCLTVHGYSEIQLVLRLLNELFDLSEPDASLDLLVRLLLLADAQTVLRQNARVLVAQGLVLHKHREERANGEKCMT